MGKNLFRVPVPPFEFQKIFRQFVVKSFADDVARISCGDCVWRNVGRDDGIRTDDGAVADVNAGHDRYVLSKWSNRQIHRQVADFFYPFPAYQHIQHFNGIFRSGGFYGFNKFI